MMKGFDGLVRRSGEGVSLVAKFALGGFLECFHVDIIRCRVLVHDQFQASCSTDLLVRRVAEIGKVLADRGELLVLAIRIGTQV